MSPATKQKYVVTWNTKDPKISIPKLLAEGIKLDPGVTLLLPPLHVLGQQMGFVIVETDQPLLLQAAIMAWHEAVQCSIFPVFSNDEIKPVLAASHFAKPAHTK